MESRSAKTVLQILAVSLISGILALFACYTIVKTVSGRQRVVYASFENDGTQPVVRTAPVPAPAAAAVVETVEPLRRDIFFPINVTAIQATEAQKVKDIADYLQKYPNAKVVVTGYADAGTGNDRINDRLAAGRADTVVKALMNQYGIAQSRISYDSKGSRVQPFAENDMNRVSICIAE